MRFPCLTLLLCLQVAAFAQSPGFSFNNIGLAQGMSQSSVVDIAQDSRGFIWLATQDGLNRFDGKEFQVFDRKFDDVTTGSYSRLGRIIPAHDQKLWMITRGGQLEQVDLLTQRMSPALPAPVASGHVFTAMITAGRDSLYLGTQHGELFLYNVAARRMLGSYQLPDSAGAVNDLMRGNRGELWIAAKGIFRLEAGKLRAVSSPVNTRGVVFQTLQQDKRGRLWIGSIGHGLFHIVPGGSLMAFTACQPALPPDLVIEDLLADADDRIWIGTYGKGLYLVNPVTGDCHHFINDKKDPFSLAFDDVLSIRQDSEQGIWIGTDGGGVSYYNQRGNQFLLFSKQNVPPEIEIGVIRSIVSDRTGAVWAGTSNEGLTRLDYRQGFYRTWRFNGFNAGINNPNRVLSLAVADDDLLWVGTQGNGILLFDPATGDTRRWFHPNARGLLKIPDGTTWCFLRAGSRLVWAGTEQAGLCLIDQDKGLVNKYVPAGDAANDAIRCIAPLNDSSLLLGYARTGIRLFDTHRHQFTEIHSPALDSFFASGTGVKSVYAKGSMIWIGTDGKGLLAFDLRDHRLRSLTVKNGLPNNMIYAILPDRQGNLWVSTNKGLSRFASTVIEGQPHPSQFSNYTTAQGLQSNEFNTGAAWRSPEGLLFFGGISGLNILDPAKINTADQPVSVVFTRLMVDNDPLAGDTAAAYRKLIVLNYRNRSVGFNFAALDFSSSHQYHYFYKLEGYDKQWIDAVQRNYVSYSNIRPGNYRFLVKYAREAEMDGDPVSAIAVIVKAPFWKKAPFIIAMVLLALAIIYGIYRYRLTQVVRLLKVRQRIAADLHDDIGSTLSNINILSELSKNSLGDPDQARTFLERISEEVQSSSQSLDDIIWSINTHNDTWDEVFSRMRRYAAEVFDTSGTSYSLLLDDSEARMRIDMEKRRDLFLVYKEILNNIHRHAKASLVEIHVRFREHQLLIDISDNGCGFDPTAATHRNGLKNMRKRVERWHGTLKIDTGSDGTRISIIL